MDVDYASKLANSTRAYLIAPAGTGKTYTIAAAVALSAGQDLPQLVLTHTHAGVHALRRKLSERHVMPGAYEVDTIAGWALRYVVAYPKMAGIVDLMPHESRHWLPTGNEWRRVYSGASRLLAKSAIKDVVRASYSGLYIDEYQDCTESQHALMMALADLLPCRILGDPLQGIYGFGDEELVDMDTLSGEGFLPLPPLDKARRWEDGRGNPELGEWLLNVVRPALEHGEELNLQSLSGIWSEPKDGEYHRQAMGKCRALLAETGNAVVIRSIANECHDTARHLVGGYQSIEPNQSDDLADWCNRLENMTGDHLSDGVIGFARACMTTIPQGLTSIRGQSKVELCALARQPSLAGISKALDALATFGREKGGRIFRREMLDDLHRAIRECCSGRFVSLTEAAGHVRMRRSQIGRRIPNRVVSRTLLIKGLEFDHAVVVLSGKEDAKNLYVAMTRGSRSLTVISKDPVINPGKEQTKSSARRGPQISHSENPQGVLEME